MFDSDVQRIQCQEYMRQSIRHRLPIVGHRYIENILPDDYMKAIAFMNNMDYTSQEFLDFLNMFTTTPITRRLRTGSGNLEFFAMQRSPIEILFAEGPSSNGPITKGNITVSSSFTEQVTVEFVAYSLLYLQTSIHRGEPIYKMELVKSDEELADVKSVASEKLFLTEIPIPDYINEKCIKLQQITLQADHAGDDSVDLFDLMKNPEIAEMLQFYKTNKKIMDFIHVTVYEETDLLDGARFNLDRRSLKLTIRDMDVYKNYYVTVYIDKARMAEIKQHLFETDKINCIR